MQKYFLWIAVLFAISVPLIAQPDGIMPRPEQHLALPYFEVDFAHGDGVTANFGVHNPEAFRTTVVARFLTDVNREGISCEFELAPEQRRTFSIREVLQWGKCPDGNGDGVAEMVCDDGTNTCPELLHYQAAYLGQQSMLDGLYRGMHMPAENQIARGFVSIRSIGGADLTGSYYIINPAGQRAGVERLIRINRVDCGEQCKTHVMEYMAGGPFAGGTDFVINAWDGYTILPASPNPITEFPHRLSAELFVEATGEHFTTVADFPIPTAGIVNIFDLLGDLADEYPFGSINLITEDPSMKVYVVEAEGGRFSGAAGPWCREDEGMPEPPQCTEPPHISVSGDVDGGFVGQPFTVTCRAAGVPTSVSFAPAQPDMLVNGGTAIGIPSVAGEAICSARNACGSSKVRIPIIEGPQQCVDLSIHSIDGNNVFTKGEYSRYCVDLSGTEPIDVDDASLAALGLQGEIDGLRYCVSGTPTKTGGDTVTLSNACPSRLDISVTVQDEPCDEFPSFGGFEGSTEGVAGQSFWARWELLGDAPFSIAQQDLPAGLSATIVEEDGKFYLEISGDQPAEGSGSVLIQNECGLCSEPVSVTVLPDPECKELVLVNESGNTTYYVGDQIDYCVQVAGDLPVSTSGVSLPNGVTFGQAASMEFCFGGTATEKGVARADLNNQCGGEPITISIKIDDPPQGEFQGCTPGYWKQTHHYHSWVGYSSTDSFNNTFGKLAFNPDINLGAALHLDGDGNGLDALAKHATAALLNAAHGSVNYPYTTGEVIEKFQEAFDSKQYEATKSLFNAANNAGCPLDNS